MKTLTWQKPGQQNVAQELIKIIINYVAELRITLGYNIDCKKIEKYVKNIRVTFSVNNVATITGYSGLSPMINSTTVDKDNNDLGMDNKRFYPLSRTYSLGLSVNF